MWGITFPEPPAPLSGPLALPRKFAHVAKTNGRPWSGRLGFQSEAVTRPFGSLPPRNRLRSPAHGPAGPWAYQDGKEGCRTCGHGRPCQNRDSLRFDGTSGEMGAFSFHFPEVTTGPKAGSSQLDFHLSPPCDRSGARISVLFFLSDRFSSRPFSHFPVRGRRLGFQGFFGSTIGAGSGALSSG